MKLISKKVTCLTKFIINREECNNEKKLNNEYRSAKKIRYMPGLDGLRAIAVIGIIIYHLNKQWLTGGFLGVDTFLLFQVI